MTKKPRGALPHLPNPEGRPCVVRAPQYLLQWCVLRPDGSIYSRHRTEAPAHKSLRELIKSEVHHARVKVFG
jgi:hypothetical protein